MNNKSLIILGSAIPPEDFIGEERHADVIKISEKNLLCRLTVPYQIGDHWIEYVHASSRGQINFREAIKKKSKVSCSIVAVDPAMVSDNYPFALEGWRGGFADIIDVEFQ